MKRRNRLVSLDKLSILDFFYLNHGDHSLSKSKHVNVPPLV